MRLSPPGSVSTQLLPTEFSRTFLEAQSPGSAVVSIMGLVMVRLSIFLKDASVSGVIVLRRRLGCVLLVLDGISEYGLTLSRDLELKCSVGCDCFCWSLWSLCSANLAISPAVGLPLFGVHVRVLYDVVVDFLHKVVVYRKDVAMRGWRSWTLEDDKVHPYRWLRPDLVAFAPFLCCDPRLTVDGSGVVSDPDLIDEQFRIAWLPFFCRAGRG